MQILVLRHVDCEPPAAYATELANVGDVRTVRLGVDPLPASTDFGAITAMGGPMGYGDRHEIGWIEPEVDFIRRAVADGVPVWGVCLGAQLLAAALGARVYTGNIPEVGVGNVYLTAPGKEDPVWRALEAEFPVLQWHSDSFDLPAGAELLASSDLYPHQLFRFGSSYGVQFHIEASHDLAKEWLAIPEYNQSLEQAHGPGSAAGILDDLHRAEDSILPLAGVVMAAWLKHHVVKEPTEDHRP